MHAKLLLPRDYNHNTIHDCMQIRGIFSQNCGKKTRIIEENDNKKCVVVESLVSANVEVCYLKDIQAIKQSIEYTRHALLLSHPFFSMRNQR